MLVCGPGRTCLATQTGRAHLGSSPPAPYTLPLTLHKHAVSQHQRCVPMFRLSAKTHYFLPPSSEGAFLYRGTSVCLLIERKPGGHLSQITSAYELRHAASLTLRDCGSVCKRQFPRFPARRTTAHAASRAGTALQRAHVFLFEAGSESGLKSACLRESSAGSVSRL